jgi:D-alanyl-D-alanine carboxypeptidase
MKNYRFHLAVFLIVGSAFVVAALLYAGSSRGHAQTRGTGKVGKSSVKTTAAVRPSSSSMSPAAARNAALSAELNWTFGGKQQRGWYLYAPLINRLLNTDHDVASEGFASALAGWQKKSNLSPTGVLDENTLYAIVSEWQGKRLKQKTPARPDQLMTAPVSDFYDPKRLDELRQVERETYVAYKRMIAAAIADKSLGLARGGNGELASGEKYLKIISAFRSREYQDKLRRESPNAGRAGLAVNSPHFTGRALDLYVGGEPVETKDSNRAIQVQTPVYQWLVRNAERFGFRPYYYEPWHWEYVGR